MPAILSMTIIKALDNFMLVIESSGNMQNYNG